MTIAPVNHNLPASAVHNPSHLNIENACLTIFIKRLRKESEPEKFIIFMKPQSTLGDLKKRISSVQQIPPDQQRLIELMPLNDQRTLQDYNVKNLSTLTLCSNSDYPCSDKAQLVYIMTLAGTKITVDFDPEDIVEDLKKKIYVLKGIPPDQQRIIFEGNELKELIVKKTLQDYGIQPQSTMYLVLRLRAGGIGFDFSNLEDAQSRDFSETAPPWLTVASGLNLIGTCLNTACQAFQKRVFIMKGMGSFDLGEQCYRARCPQCTSTAKKVNNLAFVECNYTVKGYQKPLEEQNNAEGIDVFFEGTVKDGWLTFNPEQVDWSYLNITTTYIENQSSTAKPTTTRSPATDATDDHARKHSAIQKPPATQNSTSGASNSCVIV